jgi:hypothetical protein
MTRAIGIDHASEAMFEISHFFPLRTQTVVDRL